MKVFITGATGFVGAHLTRLLVNEGCQVHAMVRSEKNLGHLQDVQDSINILFSDLNTQLRYEEYLNAIQPDLCFHLAWYAEPGKYLASPDNIQYLIDSLKLVSVLAECNCKRIVVAGTCAEYDHDLGYLSEHSPTRPGTLYAASKVALHTLLSQWVEQIDIELAWARIFYIYGPYENPRRFVPDIITTLLRGEPTRTTLGEQVRDYSHVGDVAQALWALGRSDLTGAVNIGSGLPVTNREIVLKVASILDRPELAKFGDLPYRPGDPMFVCADNRLLKGSTGWKVRYGIDAGLRNTIDWWREHLDDS